MQILRVHQESFHQDQIPKEFHFTLKIPDDIPKQVDYIYMHQLRSLKHTLYYRKHFDISKTTFKQQCQC